MKDPWTTRWGLVMAASLAACSAPTISALRAPDTVRPAALEPLSVPAPDPEGVRALAGFQCEAVVTGLSYPTSIEVDETGQLYIAEAGAVPGDPWGQPRIVRVSPQGDVRLVTDRLVAPVSDLLWHDGRLLVSHRGRISAVEPDGSVRDLVTGLPSMGDHTNTQLFVGPDGKLYFGQGTVTNSGVVGLDSFVSGWLPQFPDAYDRPARDVRASTDAYTAVNPFLLAGGEGDYTVATEPFAAFGSEPVDDDGEDGRLIVASDRPTGCIYRCNLDGSSLEVYAWGLRNPTGVVWGNDGQLYASNQGMEERGSRPIANAPDELWLIKQNAWYGWPDYAAGQPITQHHFAPSYGEPPAFLLENHPAVEQPLLTLPPQSEVAKLARAVGDRFGDSRHLFLAITGDCTSDRIDALPQIVRVDPLNRRMETFLSGATARVVDQGLGGGVAGQATTGLRRPVDVVFSPKGDALYVVDLGVFTLLPTRFPVVRPYAGSGVVWRVVPDGVAVLPKAGVSLSPPPVSPAEGPKPEPPKVETRKPDEPRRPEEAKKPEEVKK
jgi:glucose/arabinose dehydrogenase